MHERACSMALVRNSAGTRHGWVYGGDPGGEASAALGAPLSMFMRIGSIPSRMRSSLYLASASKVSCLSAVSA